MEWRRDRFLLTNEEPPEVLASTFSLLQTTYWSHVRPIEVVEKVLRTSLCFFLLDDENHIGFARVVTDYATTSWLSDVVLDANYRNDGIGTWMMQCILHTP